MPDYQKGKIYKITGTNDEGIELVYIGSTIQKLSTRLVEHRRSINMCSSKLIFDTCLNIMITLIQNYPCNSKEELNARERYYYDLFDCINKNRPNRTKEELTQIKQEYASKYYNKKKIQINLKQKERITCCCGVPCNKSYLSVHRRSPKHIDYINSTKLVV